VSDRARVVRLIDGATVVLVAAAAAVAIGRWANRARPITRKGGNAVTVAQGSPYAGLDDSTMPLPSGQRLSRLERHDLTVSGLSTGATAPIVEVVVYFDYECGWCAVYDSALRRIEARYPDVVAVVYKALIGDTLSPSVLDAHAAAYCAAAVHEFKAYHHAAMAHQNLVSYLQGWRQIARLAGIDDSGPFERCVLGDRFRPAVLESVREARSFGFQSTPSSIIGRFPAVGNLSYTTLDSLAGVALSEARGR
jgi:protein-disulfide isomerase